MQVIQRKRDGQYVYMDRNGMPVPMMRHEAEAVIDLYGYQETMPDQRDWYDRTFYLPTAGAK